MIVQPIDLNMIPDSPPVILHCDQYDEGTGRISAHLYDGDQSYAPTNATVMIQGTKPDGKGFQYAATISGNVVTADLTKQMTAVAGNVRTQIVVTESSGRTGSFAFTLSVQKSALPSDTDMSASDYQIIEELIEDVQEAVGTATQSASDAEAWAVGERGGEPVPPTDPTYENNAEYWAHYAEEHGSVPVMTGSILGIGSPDDLTTIATNGIITAKGVAISATVNPSGTEHGANWLKHGTTVLTPDSEQMYLVYIDNAPTLWTWDGLAYVQITGGGGPTGSTITVTTTETTLFGEDVALTDGTSTLTETFDNTGTAVFTGVTMTGTLTATSTDGSSTATGTVTVTDPGTYTVQINFWIATINITTDSPDLYGQTITVKNSNNVTVATTTFSNLGAASVTVGSADTYTVSCLTESDNVTVSAQTTYSVSLHLWTATLSISTSDSSLYGEPIDIQRGGTYVGRTTFSNAGTATYNVHDTGTYYVTCQGNTETVTVSAETTYNVTISSYNVRLTTSASVLEGETVTATNGNSTVTKTITNGEATFNLAAGKWEIAGIPITVVAGQTYQKELVVFAFHYSENDSSPSSVSYPSGYNNYGWTPFAMNLSTGVPDYGSWNPSGANASKLTWFYPKSCMLKYDGTVDYYLNDNDLTKKADNTASDVADTSYGGNAMMEWGQDGYRVHWKLVPDNDGKGLTFIVGNTNALSLIPWNHYDCLNNVNKHFYWAIFFGSYSNSKMRSISGQSNVTNETPSALDNAARANNTTSAVIWDTEVYSDRILLQMLCVLLSKSLDSQGKFGNGVCSQATGTPPIAQGSMNDKGLFYGKSDQVSGVKVFGIENPWGNLWRSVRGVINDNGTVKAKMTHGTQDGSTASDYNYDGTGYISIGTIGGTSGGYISEMTIKEYGLFPKTISGSGSTYYADGSWFTNTQINCAYASGSYYDYGSLCGVFLLALNSAFSYKNHDIGAALSCKPLA